VPSDDLAAVAALFEAAGGTWVTPPAVVAERLAACRALVLDWDGVFNTGAKAAGSPSGFSEPDSMGLNLARYGLWRAHGRLPVTVVLSGEDNPTATAFATRENFDAVYLGMTDKREPLRHLCQAHGIAPGQVAVVFDDANDLALAAECGLRFLVSRAASPLLGRYAATHGLCDYATANGGGSHAVREVAEVVLGCLGQHEAVFASRAAFDADYQAYLAARRLTAIAHHTGPMSLGSAPR
jgi:3-deoxy-D-manno-octulosonate 8-phosphate phosphatase KdsC-like HAD superfamily phosphatase